MEDPVFCFVSQAFMVSSETAGFNTTSFAPPKIWNSSVKRSVFTHKPPFQFWLSNPYDLPTYNWTAFLSPCFPQKRTPVARFILENMVLFLSSHTLPFFSHHTLGIPSCWSQDTSFLVLKPENLKVSAFLSQIVTAGTKKCFDVQNLLSPANGSSSVKRLDMSGWKRTLWLVT